MSATAAPDRGPGDPAIELLRLLSAGATSAELAAVDAPHAARELALNVRREIATAHRREAQLEALVETAKDLASMRDPAGVLDAIVRRARSLLRTDLAYLTLHDPERGDTYMRATSGSVSAAFQSVRLPSGAGLGGLVAKTRMPYATPNYMEDQRFRHTRGIDGPVGEEGCVAIVGTPLLVGERFVGVLFAAQRSPRQFDPDEVSLLGSLAALAAVSLVQSRTLLEAQTALEALSAAHETARRHTLGIERAAAAHDRFAEVLLSGGGLDEVTRALSELLGGWVVLTGEDGSRRSAHGPHLPSPDGPEGEIADPLARHPAAALARESGRLATRDGVHAAPILAAKDPLGMLLIGGVAELDDADRRTVERAAVVSALVLMFEREAASRRRQFQSEVLADLIGERGERHERVHAARSVGLRLDEPCVVLAVGSAAPTSGRALALTVGHALGDGALVGVHEGAVLAVVAGSDPGEAAAALARRLRPGTVATVGGSGPVTGGEGIGDAVAEARRTLDALRSLGHEGRGAAASELGFAGLVVGSSPDVRAFVESVLGPVLGYDAERGTELVGTLEAWFAAGGSPRHAASRLHVHSNTVAQRIERVGRLLGRDWASPQRALQVQLALHLRHLLPTD